MTLLRSSPPSHEPRSASIKNSLRRIPSSLFRTESADSPRKDKHAKRKGLTNILGWARSESPPPPVPPITASGSFGKTGSAVATLTAAKGGAGQKRSAPLKRRKGHGASAWAHSLRSTSTTPEPLAPEHKTRPSCPPDPFERLDSSYNSHVINRPPTVNQIENTSDSSITSCAPNITTVSIDDVDDADDLHEHDATFDDDSWVASLSNFEVPPLPLGFHPNDSVDVPFCTVPSRSWKASQALKERRPSSLGLEITLDAIVETPEEPPHAAKLLRREKTKSRVWGILTGKKKAPLDGPSSRPSTPSNALQRTPIPTLYLTKPSNDSIQPSPPKPRVSPSSHLKPSAPSPGGQQPTVRGQHAKTLPKRKSLSGLFGISLKKSSGRLRSPIASPKNSPRRNFARTVKIPGRHTPSSTPFKATPSRKANGGSTSQTRNNTGSTRKLHTPESDCSPETTTFFSRFGNPKGSIKQTDVTIGDTTCATTQLERFLASIDPSVSPAPLRKMRSAILPGALKRGSISKGPGSAASTPGQARRGRLSSSPGPSSPVFNLMKGVRSMLSTSPPSSPAGDYSLVLPPEVEDEVKPRWNLELESPMNANGIVANITPPTPIISSPTESRDASQFLSACENKILATPPTRLHTPLPGLPPLPPADRKVDRLAQRRQHGKPVTQWSGSDGLEPATDDENIRASFDFTHEVLNLERGDGRTSFIRALHHALSQEVLDSPLRQYSPSAKSRYSPQADRANRSAPFEGQPAFQKFVEQTRTVRQAKASPPPFTAPPPFALPPLPTELPPLPTAGLETQIKEHRRYESSKSGFSFGSISSLGAPLGGSTLNHDYTNYFEANYTGINDAPPLLPPLASMPLYSSSLVLSRPNHKHSTSASSTGSLAGAEISYVSGSIRCTSRASYLTRRPLQSSTASRIDQSMTHDRHQSNASSIVSPAFIARPTVGERMFERDETVRLESFHERRETCWSFASYDGSGEAESLEESVFCAINKSPRKEFLIKSRPLSGISASSSEGNDTFNGHSPTFDKAMAPRGSRELRSASYPRLSRHRPQPLKLSDMTLDTPGLDTAYTSADDSSLFSFDSRGGSTAPLAAPFTGPTASSFSAFLPYKHNRHHSSIATGVKVEATIPEENSQSSLRSTPSSIASQRNNLDYWNEGQSVSTTWVKLNREVEDVYHENRDIWHSTIFTKEEMIKIRQPETSAEVQQFLADSKAKYKPLELVTVVRTRKSSTSRVAAGPYNGPIPPLESRFRNKRHSADECDCERPVSALLLEFAREQAPQQKSTAPKTSNRRTCRGSGSDPDSSRQSVTNSVRRRNLGWSRRRRNSDSVSGSISSVQLADDEVFGPSQVKPLKEKQPSFIYLRNLDQEDSNDFQSLADLPPSPLAPKSRSRSRRCGDVLITSGGSPVNLNLELDPSPLIGRRDANRLSYEPRQSPISMPTFQPITRPAPPRKRKVSMASTTRTTRPSAISGTRVALGDSTIPQVNRVILKSSSSPQMKTKSTYPTGRRPQPMPWAAQKENNRPHSQLRPMVLQPVPRATLV